jgi:hypothetical protein
VALAHNVLVRFGRREWKFDVVTWYDTFRDPAPVLTNHWYVVKQRLSYVRVFDRTRRHGQLRQPSIECESGNQRSSIHNNPKSHANSANVFHGSCMQVINSLQHKRFITLVTLNTAWF